MFNFTLQVRRNRLFSNYTMLITTGILWAAEVLGDGQSCAEAVRSMVWESANRSRMARTFQGLNYLYFPLLWLWYWNPLFFRCIDCSCQLILGFNLTSHFIYVIQVICSCLNLDELGVPAFILSYNAKPVLIRRTGSIHPGPGYGTSAGCQYMEMDIHVHKFAMAAKKSIHLLSSRCGLMYMQIGFVIEVNYAVLYYVVMKISQWLFVSWCLLCWELMSVLYYARCDYR